jgi:ElaB/YqjD/DUF883 family membrane-anchored ribosome-binding protein
MTTATEAAAQAVREYAAPIRAAVEENLREVQRAVVGARQAVEDGAADATVQVRRHPFVSLGVAAAVGLLVGGLIGLTAGRFGERRT